MNLKLMVLGKNIKTGETNENDTWESVKDKLTEEFLEVTAAIRHEDYLNLGEELMDLIQVAIRGLDLLEEEGMNLEEVFNRHNKKLVNRGWTEKKIINIRVR